MWCWAIFVFWPWWRQVYRYCIHWVAFLASLLYMKSYLLIKKIYIYWYRKVTRFVSYMASTYQLKHLHPQTSNCKKDNQFIKALLITIKLQRRMLLLSSFNSSHASPLQIHCSNTENLRKENISQIFPIYVNLPISKPYKTQIHTKK